MEFPEETPAAPKPITVKQLVYRLRDTVSIAMGTQWVVGELSNVKHHTSGHVYFTLKEQGAEIFCAFFKAAASKCPIRLQEGMKDRKSTRLNSSHSAKSRMPSSA